MPGQRAQRGAAVAAGLFQQDGAAAGQGQAFHLPAPFQKGPVGILSGGDEAYLLAFLRHGHVQARLPHLGDAGGLVLPGKGEHGPAQALQGHEGEEIALVLGQVGRRGQQRAGRALLQAGVVAGGDAVGAQAQGGVQQGPELDGPVAERAGIGRPAPGIGPHEGRDDLPVEDGAHVGHMQGDAQLPAGCAQAFHRLTAGRGQGRVQSFRRREQTGAVMGRARAGGSGIGQEEPVQGQDVVSLSAQAQEGAEAVHAAADGNGQLCHQKSPWRPAGPGEGCENSPSEKLTGCGKPWAGKRLTGSGSGTGAGADGAAS